MFVNTEEAQLLMIDPFSSARTHAN